MPEQRRYMNRAHRYDEDPHSNARNCRCGMGSAWRFHQPWWWRWLNPGARWRHA